MRVVLVANTSISMVWFRLPLLRELIRRGHRVWVIAPEDRGVAEIIETGCSFFPLGQNQGWAHDKSSQKRRHSYVDPFTDLRTVRGLARTLRTLQPDVLMAYTPKLSVLSAAAGRLAGVPHVHGMFTGLGYANLDGGRRKAVLRNAFRAAMRTTAALCDSIIVLNPDNLAEAVDRGLVPRDKAFLLDGEGVDVSKFNSTPPTYERGKATFLSVGRLVWFKGAGVLVDAARIVKKDFPDARFVVAGGHDPTHPAAIPSDTLQAWKDEGLVEFPGHVSGIVDLIADSDAFVLPSFENEGLPMSIMEAMAMSRPIVTTLAPGNRETVEDGVNGFLVPMRSPEELADRLSRILDDPALGKTMGAESRALCERRFSADIVNETLLAHLGL